jgi:hypothetical protein
MSAQLPLLIAILVAVVSAITVAARCLRRGGAQVTSGMAGFSR